MLGLEVFVDYDDDFSLWSKYLPQNWSVLSQLSSLTLMNTGIETHIKNTPSLTLINLKHLRITHAVDSGSLVVDMTNWALVLRGAKSLETLSLSLPEIDITELVQSLRSDCLQVCLLCFYSVSGDALVDFILHHAASLQRLGLAGRITGIELSSVFSSIAGRLSALQRMQLENIRGGPRGYLITSDCARDAERFVALAGPPPVLRFERLLSSTGYTESGRGTYTDGPKPNELLPGLWQDYEGIANKEWDGCI